MTRRPTLPIVAALSVLALGLRVGVIFHYKAWRSPAAMEHKTIASALVTGHGFTFGDWGYYGPTSVQSPPMPFLLAGLFEVFGTDVPKDHSLHGANLAYLAVMLVNAAAGAGLVWLTYAMVRTVGGNATAAVVAAGLVAVWPEQVYTARVVQVVSLATVAVVATTLLFYRAVRSGGLGAWVGFAVVMAVATLAEPVFLPALGLTGVLILFWRGLPGSVRVRNAAVLAFAAVAVIGPWTARNYAVHGHLIPIKGSFWVNIWKGSNDSASGSDRVAMKPADRARAWKQGGGSSDEVTDTPHQYDMLDISQRVRLANHTEPEREAMFRGWALAWLRTHKLRYAQLCGVRLVKTLTIDWDYPKSFNPIYIAGRAGVLLLGVGGLVVAVRQRWSLLFPAMLVATALATYTLTLTAARFALPFEPLELAVGGGLIAALLGRPATAGPAVGYDRVVAREPAVVAA